MSYRKLCAGAVLILLAVSPAFTFEEGWASWYGGKFHGRETASGEIFNTNDFTAAHRTLAFGTRLKVTNTANGKSVIVRVNDRGPFVKGRIIDLSQAAAIELDMIGAGTAYVRIEQIGSESPAAGLASPGGSEAPAASPAGTKSGGTAPSLLVQVASYRVKENAVETRDLLIKNGIDAELETTSQGMIRVVIGNVQSASLRDLKQNLAGLGFPQVLIRQVPGM